MKTLTTSLATVAALLGSPLCAAPLTDNTAISYIGSDGTRRIHNFANSNIGQDGLVENRFDGSSWQWIGHPVPSDKYGPAFPNAITYEENGTQRIYVFSIAGNGHRFVTRYFNGTTWDWALLPTDSFLRMEKFAAFTYVDELGSRRIELFGMDDPGTFNGLVRTWWDGSAWNSKKISPKDHTWVGAPVAVTYSEKGTQRIEIFCTVTEYESSVRKLYSYSWQRNSWQWKDHGLQDFIPKSAITFKDAGDPRHIQIFGVNRLNNDSLAIYDWNGTTWTLIDLGKPATETAAPSDVSTITFMSNDGHRQIFVAAIFNDHLYFRRHNGSGWSSYASFSGGTSQFANDPAMVFYPDPRSGNDTLQMFVSSADGLKRHRWNGSSWQSYNQGAP